LLSYPNALSNSKFFYLFLDQLNIVSLQNTSRRQNELEENLAGRNPKVEPYIREGRREEGQGWGGRREE